MLPRKKENRKRPKKENVLDVKARSDSTSRRRAQVVFMALSFFVGIVGSAWGIWKGGEYLLNRFVYESKSFAIQKIEIRSNGIITRERLLHWAGVKVGDNLLELDLPRVKTNLELAPNIRSVSLERKLPNVLKIRVWEHHPVARFVAVLPRGDNGSYQRMEYLLDAEGFVMLPIDPQYRIATAREREKSLPMLIKLDPAKLRLGARIEGLTVRSALQLIGTFPQSRMIKETMLKSIDVSAPTTLLVRDENGSQITFGFDRYENQLNRWKLVYDRGLSHGLRIQSLDLSIQNNIPAIWRPVEKSARSHSKPAIEATKPNRKTNV
jgi:hypothetical protein